MEREFGKYVKSVMVRGAKYNDERKNTRGVEMNCRNMMKLQKIFGSGPQIRIMEFLLDFDEYHVTISDIARETNASRNTTTKILKNLFIEGLIEQSKRKVQGRRKYFILNNKSKIVKLLRQMCI